jgi:hypothetical protein
MFPPLFMRFHRDRQLSHMNRRIIMGAVHHIVLDRRIITGAVNHIISDDLQCAILAVEGVRRCQWDGHRERVPKTFPWDHRVRDPGLICRCILIGMKVRRGGNSCMNEKRGNDLAAFGGAIKFHTSRANAQQSERPRECAIIFRDLVGKLTVLEIECEKCGRSRICASLDMRNRIGALEGCRRCTGLFTSEGPCSRRTRRQSAVASRV